jgi:Lrp/AsnC family leucine-responsive transcriptional regulator
MTLNTPPEQTGPFPCDIYERWKGLDLKLLPIDQTDIKILCELLENARMSNSEIANRLSITEATVRRRIKNLVEKGIIMKFSIHINYKLIENTVKAYIQVKAATDKLDVIVKKILDHNRVVACYRVTGEYDLLVVTLFVGMGELQEFIDTFLKMDGVKETQTQIVMSALKGVPWTGI